jgi:hypothetical protein
MTKLRIFLYPLHVGHDIYTTTPPSAVKFTPITPIVMLVPKNFIGLREQATVFDRLDVSLNL